MFAKYIWNCMSCLVFKFIITIIHTEFTFFLNAAAISIIIIIVIIIILILCYVMLYSNYQTQYLLLNTDDNLNHPHQKQQPANLSALNITTICLYIKLHCIFSKMFLNMNFMQVKLKMMIKNKVM